MGMFRCEFFFDSQETFWSRFFHTSNLEHAHCQKIGDHGGPDGDDGVYRTQEHREPGDPREMARWMTRGGVSNIIHRTSVMRRAGQMYVDLRTTDIVWK